MTHHEHLADLYLRLSLDREGKTAIERQEADCRAWAVRNGLEVRTVHVDRGRSGYKDITRKGFDAAVSALTTGVVGTLIIWKVDRLSRRGIGQVGSVLDAVEKVGGRLVFVQDGLDTSQQQARLVLALLSEVARTESANIGTRVASAKAYGRPLGKWQGGPTPFGLRLNASGRLEHDPATAPAAREMAEAALAGTSLRKIAADLNARGILTDRGGPWVGGVVSRLLKGPAFAGLLPESVKVDGKHAGYSVAWRSPETGETLCIGAGIITPAEQVKIVRQLEERTDADNTGCRRGTRALPQHLLTGMMRCGTCDGRTAVNGVSYTCQRHRVGRTCKAPAYGLVSAVDRAVFAAWAAKLASLTPGDPLLDAVAERWVEQHDPDVIKQRETITAALDDATGALADLEDARYLRSEFVGPEAVQRWTRLHERLTNRVDGLRRNLASFPLPEADITPLLDPVHTAVAWQLAELPERRALLALAIEYVTLLPATKIGARFDPRKRLLFAWAASQPDHT